MPLAPAHTPCVGGRFRAVSCTRGGGVFSWGSRMLSNTWGCWQLPLGPLAFGGLDQSVSMSVWMCVCACCVGAYVRVCDVSACSRRGAHTGSRSCEPCPERPSPWGASQERAIHSPSARIPSERARCERTGSPCMIRTLDKQARSERVGCPYVTWNLIERARCERFESPCSAHPYISFVRVPWGSDGWSRVDHVDDVEC